MTLKELLSLLASRTLLGGFLTVMSSGQGVNRAFPYVSSNEADDIIEVQTPMLFKLVKAQGLAASSLFLSCNKIHSSNG